MAIVKDPTQWFGHCIGWVDFAWDVLQDNGAIAFPVLDREIWYVNVARAFSGYAGIDN